MRQYPHQKSILLVDHLWLSFHNSGILGPCKGESTHTMSCILFVYIFNQCWIKRLVIRSTKINWREKFHEWEAKLLMLDWDAIRQLEKPTKSYHPIHIIAEKFVEPYFSILYFDFAILQEEEGTSRWQKQQDQGRKKHWQWPGWGLTQDQPEQLAI